MRYTLLALSICVILVACSEPPKPTPTLPRVVASNYPDVDVLPKYHPSVIREAVQKYIDSHCEGAEYRGYKDGALHRAWVPNITNKYDKRDDLSKAGQEPWRNTHYLDNGNWSISVFPQASFLPPNMLTPIVIFRYNENTGDISIKSGHVLFKCS